MYDEGTVPAGRLEKACLALLADMLTDAGGGDVDILEHGRGGGEQVHECRMVEFAARNGANGRGRTRRIPAASWEWHPLKMGAFARRPTAPDTSGPW
jgi:hypothetical protein